MVTATGARLTRRERQILDLIYRLGEASVADIMARLPRAPTAGAVRRMLNLLHAKGAVAYRQDGARKLYRPAVGKAKAGKKALEHVIETFFAGSAARTMASLMENPDLDLTEDDRRALALLIEKARKEGR